MWDYTGIDIWHSFIMKNSQKLIDAFRVSEIALAHLDKDKILQLRKAIINLKTEAEKMIGDMG